MRAMTSAVAILSIALESLVASAAPSAEVLKVRAWRQTRERQIVSELMQLVALPNIASNREDIAKNADVLTTMFEKRDFSVSRVATPGSPVLIARRDVPNALGTLTFYMHYDGQPSDPTQWTKGAPFAPVAMLGDATFDLTTTSAPLTWSVRMVLDGEEEAGSPNFTAAMSRNVAAVRSDLAVIVDSPRHPSGLPTVFYGSRGTSGAVIQVYGANGDLHSGNYGNFTTDPTMALAKLRPTLSITGIESGAAGDVSGDQGDPRARSTPCADADDWRQPAVLDVQ